MTHGSSLFMLVIGSTVSILLIILLVVGTFLLVKAVKKTRSQPKAAQPIKRELLIFNPPTRVFVEFASSLFGFPGMGWILSGKIVIGVGLISIVPSFIWALLPVYAVFSGELANDPFTIVKYLPWMALISAGSLALNQIITATTLRKQAN